MGRGAVVQREAVQQMGRGAEEAEVQRRRGAEGQWGRVGAERQRGRGVAGQTDNHGSDDSSSRTPKHDFLFTLATLGGGRANRIA